MQKNTFKKIGITLMSGAILAGVFVPTVASANENNEANEQKTEQVQNNNDASENELVNTQQDNTELFQQADQYVKVENNKYVLNDHAKTEFSSDKIQVIQNQIDQSNNKINAQGLTINNDNKMAVEEQSTNGPKFNVFAKSKGGVTKVTFHWNYVRIYLKAADVKTALELGAGVGSVYAPAKIVAAALTGLGVGISNVNIKRGIWFDYNPVSIKLINNYGFQ